MKLFIFNYISPRQDNTWWHTVELSWFGLSGLRYEWNTRLYQFDTVVYNFEYWLATSVFVEKVWFRKWLYKRTGNCFDAGVIDNEWLWRESKRKEPGRIKHVYTCKACKKKITTYETGIPIDWSPQSIKDGRKEYAKELLQPFRQGEVSKEYLEAYPKQREGMIKEGIITRRQAENARNVWGRDIY